MSDGRLVVHAPPHSHSGASIPATMYAVALSLLPVMVGSALYFGVATLLLYLVSIVCCVATELITRIVRKKEWRSVLDGSALVTAVLLVMVLPPDTSPVLVGFGSIVAIFIGKEVFGGLGHNVFNPALVGRAFLAAAYPVQMTTWTTPNDLLPFLTGSLTSRPDALSAATPLAAARFDGVFEQPMRLLFGAVGGSIGETSALLIIAGGLVLVALRIVRWQMVASYLGTVAALTGIFWLVDSQTYASPHFHLLAGGVMLAAFYMVTDMVTTPYTLKGTLLFGVGAGALTAIIRLFGGFPEGAMYAVLLMNAVTPLINRYVENRVFGEVASEEDQA